MIISKLKGLAEEKFGGNLYHAAIWCALNENETEAKVVGPEIPPGFVQYAMIRETFSMVSVIFGELAKQMEEQDAGKSDHTD